MSAVVDLARRAKVDARGHLWNAREAERALGRLILAAREAGDLAGQGGDRSNLRQQEVATLDDFGISYNLAALAADLASVPDEVWEAWQEQAQTLDRDPTQAAVARLRDGGAGPGRAGRRGPATRGRGVRPAAGAGEGDSHRAGHRGQRCSGRSPVSR